MIERSWLVSVVGVAAVLLSSCAFLTGEQPSTSAPPPTTSVSHDEHAGSVVVDGVRVDVSTEGDDLQRQLTLTPADIEAEPGEALTVLTTPLSVELDHGATQPSAPVRLQFDLSDRPDLAAKMTSTAVPVVESRSTKDPNEQDMFPAMWDPATQTVTAEVTHLTAFWVSVIDVLKVIEDGVGRVFGEMVRGESKSPCRNKSELNLDGTDYVLTAVRPGAVAGCLVNVDGAIGIDFQNATKAFYAITVAPETIGGEWIATQTMTMADSAGTITAGLTSTNRGVLAGRSAGRFILNRGVTEGDIRMTPQPQGILAKSLLSGMSMLNIDLKRFEHIPGTWDCFATADNATDVGPKITHGEVVNMIGDISQCLVTHAEAQGGSNARKEALHRLSVAVAVLTELPQQLGDLVAGGLEEASRTSVKDFRLRSSTPTPAPQTSVPAAPGSVIDRVEVSTWAYDRVEGDTYRADNTGAKSIQVFWKSFSGPDQVRSGCTSTVRISGPGTSETKATSNCDSYNAGTFVKAKAPGDYTVTVTVSQEGQPDVIAERTVTVLPHR